MDMYTKVRITGYLDAEIASCGNIPLIRVSYRVKRGRKDYKIWLLPEDFQGTGKFPLCYRVMNSGRYADVLDMQNDIVYTGKVSFCKEIVRLSNKRYYDVVKE